MDTSEMATRALLAEARELLESGETKDAIPYLAEITLRFKELNGSEAEETRTISMFQLGMCYLETEQYQESAEVLRAFLRDYPTHPSAIQARFLILEAYAWQDDPAPMKAYIDQLTQSGELKQLLAVFEDPARADSFRHAALTLVGAYARTADMKNLKRFLPYCDESARSDPGLNVAFIEGGDRAFEKEEYVLSLAFYRMVKMNAGLIADYDRRLVVLQQELSQPLPWVPLKRRDEQQAHREAETARFEQMQVERNVLEQKSYDVDVMIRMAQCFNAMERRWQTYSLYENVYTKFATHELAESCRYYAFQTLMALREHVAALEEGRAYLELYPAGRFRDETTLGIVHQHLALEEMDKADTFARSLLTQVPIHRYLDQVNYLLGYLQFQDENFEEALGFFREAAEKWPTRVYAEESIYWVGMCNLFLSRFEEAVTVFDAYLVNSAWDPKEFAEDVTYRLGMARYGLGNFVASEETFRAFLVQFPSSDLVSEACSMLGDLRGAEGDLDAALDYYARARKSAVNLQQENYALFQTAQVYELQKNYIGIVELMKQYLDDRGEQGDFAEASLWAAKAWRALGENKKALNICFETVIRHGSDPQRDGLDRLLEEVLKEARDPNQEEGCVAYIKERVTSAIQSASADGETLVLRLTALRVEISAGDERTEYANVLLGQAGFTSFSPWTLLVFAELAEERGDFDRVQQAASYFMETFSSVGYTLEMINFQISSLLGKGQYEEAMILARESLDRYPDDLNAGLTQKLLADALRLTKQYDLAMDGYNEFLSVREWRGPMTPQALYWIGVCHAEKEDFLKAYAYFQRVYVLYGHYPEWTAKAYASSTDCLDALGRHEEKVQTWREMVSIPQIALTPEGRRAQAELDLLPEEVQ